MLNLEAYAMCDAHNVKSRSECLDKGDGSGKLSFISCIYIMTSLCSYLDKLFYNVINCYTNFNISYDGKN